MRLFSMVPTPEPALSGQVRSSVSVACPAIPTPAARPLSSSDTSRRSNAGNASACRPPTCRARCSAAFSVGQCGETAARARDEV